MRKRSLLLAGLIALTGCGGAVAATTTHQPDTVPPPAIPTATACADQVAQTLQAIAQRIYAQATGGRNVASATRRLARSARLARAVAAHDPVATQRALRPLLKHQIRRIVIRAQGRTLATAGTAAALAPVPGVIRDHGRTVGTYTLSVAGARELTGIMHSVTGARAILGARPAQARDARVLAFPVHRFPTGARTISLVVPRASLTTCGATPAETVADTIGAVGERLYATEAHGAATRRVLHHVTTDAAFRRAVAADDKHALWTAIVRFFRTRSLHVVRVRATDARDRLVNDVGGPDVLAPASAPIPGGGTATLAIQDDTGYIKLMHRFTGAEVILRTPAGQIAGSTLSPGPAQIPARGPLTYAGRAYQAFSFPAQAFPAGSLTISLLIPAAG